MRRNLKEARAKAGLTQKQVADAVGISLRYYKAIEAGSYTGKCWIWDQMEELFTVPQRILRENETESIHLDTKENP